MVHPIRQALRGVDTTAKEQHARAQWKTTQRLRDLEQKEQVQTQAGTPESSPAVAAKPGCGAPLRRRSPDGDVDASASVNESEGNVVDDGEEEEESEAVLNAATMFPMSADAVAAQSLIDPFRSRKTMVRSPAGSPRAEEIITGAASLPSTPAAAPAPVPAVTVPAVVPTAATAQARLAVPDNSQAAMLLRAQSLLRKRMTMIISPDGVDVDTPPRRLRGKPIPMRGASALAFGGAAARAGGALVLPPSLELSPVREGVSQPETPQSVLRVALPSPLLAQRPRSPEEEYAVSPPSPRAQAAAVAAATATARGEEADAAVAPSIALAAPSPIRTGAIAVDASAAAVVPLPTSPPPPQQAAVATPKVGSGSIAAVPPAPAHAPPAASPTPAPEPAPATTPFKVQLLQAEIGVWRQNHSDLNMRFTEQTIELARASQAAGAARHDAECEAARAAEVRTTAAAEITALKSAVSAQFARDQERRRERAEADAAVVEAQASALSVERAAHRARATQETEALRVALSDEHSEQRVADAQRVRSLHEGLAAELEEAKAELAAKNRWNAQLQREAKAMAAEADAKLDSMSTQAKELHQKLLAEVRKQRSKTASLEKKMEQRVAEHISKSALVTAELAQSQLETLSTEKAHSTLRSKVVKLESDAAALKTRAASRETKVALDSKVAAEVAEAALGEVKSQHAELLSAMTETHGVKLAAAEAAHTKMRRAAKRFATTVKTMEARKASDRAAAKAEASAAHNTMEAAVLKAAHEAVEEAVREKEIELKSEYAAEFAAAQAALASESMDTLAASALEQCAAATAEVTASKKEVSTLTKEVASLRVELRKVKSRAKELLREKKTRDATPDAIAIEAVRVELSTVKAQNARMRAALQTAKRSHAAELVSQSVKSSKAAAAAAAEALASSRKIQAQQV